MILVLYLLAGMAGVASIFYIINEMIKAKQEKFEEEVMEIIERYINEKNTK